jgi:flavin-dependent dehydrogenase
MCGDSAGLIHPLCGNGMGMAIGGARLVSESVGAFYDGEFMSRIEVEDNYKRAWHREFSSRLRSGRILAGLLRNKALLGHAMPLLRNFPVLMHQIISTTHGKLVPAR